MPSLFSTFDPQSWLHFNLNWMFFLPLTLVALAAPLLFSQFQTLMFNMLASVKAEFSAACGATAGKSVLIPALTLFFWIFLMNVSGLMPYTFTLSSHLSATAALALPLWIGHMILGVIAAPANLLSHVVPLGAPSALIPFMVIIELVSSIIRPLTLSVRLAANMIAGHLLISLLGQAVFPTFSMVLVLSLSSMFLLCALESGVSMIQAYVFSLLSSLYINEMQDVNL